MLSPMDINAAVTHVATVHPSPGELHTAAAALRSIRDSVAMRPDDDDAPRLLFLMSDQIYSGLTFIMHVMSRLAVAIEHHSSSEDLLPEAETRSLDRSRASSDAAPASAWARSLRNPRSSSAMLAQCRWRGDGAERQ